MLYKVVRVEVRGKEVVGRPKTVWEGTDIKELSARFPKTYFDNGNTLDNLRRLPGHSKGSSVVTVFLRRTSVDDKWEPFDDPRPYIVRKPHGTSITIPAEEARNIIRGNL